MGDPRRKSPLFATFLSAMPGLGQVYVGYYQRGFINAVVVGTLIALLTSTWVR
jgi:TM2 domain-containing membrane protein YozV